MVEPLANYPLTWRAAVLKDPAATFMHTPEFVRYRLAARPGSVDRSLALVDDSGGVIGVAPLVQEGDTLLDGGEPAAWPLAPDDLDRRMFISHIVQACGRWGVRRIGFRSHPGHQQSWWNTDWHTAVIDLSKDEAELWRNVRRSYHAIINGAEKSGLTVETVTDGTHVPTTCFMLHTQASGRQTRPLASWAEQGTWVGAGLAACYLARKHGQPVGFAFVSIWNGWAYYFSGASEGRNVQHAIQWHVIRDLKRRGVLFYEIGWIDKDKTNDPKAQGIEMFKRGWGGNPLQVRALEREL